MYAHRYIRTMLGLVSVALQIMCACMEMESVVHGKNRLIPGMSYAGSARYLLASDGGFLLQTTVTT